MIDQISAHLRTVSRLCALGFLLLNSHFVVAQTRKVFQLGVKDGSFREFNIVAQSNSDTTFAVGKSSLNDWPAYQPGSLDSRVRSSTMQEDWVERSAKEPSVAPPRNTINFDVPSTRGTFTIHLGMIFRYRRAAAPKLTIDVNGKSAGSYYPDPRPAPELWWPNGGEGDGNLQYFGYESLDLPLPSSFFHAGANSLSLRFTDGFGIYYDYLSLSNGESTPQMVSAELQPTVLYKNRPSGLVEMTTVRIRSTQVLGQRTLTLKVGETEIQRVFNLDHLGDILLDVEVPSVEEALPASIQISGYAQPVWQGTFQPKRKWKVYALPMEQADFGYNDLPARTLEWENRFIDRALQIQEAYPSYAFTLDAAANLESYLATRSDARETKVLEHLRSGKWGINALYANFFTGLCSAEELFRSVEYGLRAGRTHGFLVDSASQTDEPSVTWALPQVLADAGIKYFTNGSDPIRGALNPIGLLNFHSPFYWESPTGSKVLVWSAVSYTAVDDITWAGWNEESVRQGKYAPSLFGMTHSLPLFLSQYERSDFPFDTVLLFGLHNDEIPMRHWGDADLIDMWNKEYAYPKVIAGTQRDFFTHIEKNFASKIKTLRGDAGAYWEDEAGADARISAMIRESKNQIVGAEKFESVAQWLQPHLKFEKQPFDFTWKNILLADSYVWSDSNSFRRPYSYRTLGGEAAHRAWGESAHQTSSDLRLVAMDKIAELVNAAGPGAAVFNSESWSRNDFFDFELERDEALIDPVTNEPIPCASIKQSFGYNEVRCWASDIPAVGYKFFPIAKGTVSDGEPIPFDPKSPSFENSHYRLQLDPVTGAVSHLIDKDTDTELVDQSSPYKLGEYLYVTGGDPGAFRPGSPKDNRLLAADITLALPKLQIHQAQIADRPKAVRYPWGITVTTRSKAINTPDIVSTFTLLDRDKRILFDQTVHKQDTLKKEGVYFAFPFALEQPRMSYQGATAWVDPERDMLPGANRQWFATQGGVWGQGTNTNLAWATREAPLVTLQDINRGLWPESMKITSGTVFSYVMNNYWYTDTPSHQGGLFNFHYALTNGKDLSGADASRLAAEQKSPLVAIRRYNMGWDATLPAAGTGFLEASPLGVSVISITPTEKAGSFKIRMQNFTADKVTAKVDLKHVSIHDAYLGTMLGERSGTVEWNSNSVKVPLAQYEIKTIVVKTN